jgi:beta-glucosidase/6-phospho-beta-glucosidase/beta-galactosidase
MWCFSLGRSTELGVSTSAYQIEGAWNEEGRTESVWDRFSHTLGKTKDNANGDVACDHYHHWKEDLDSVEWLGAKAYRFSFSWTRILPTGRPDKINRKGVEFYNNLIDYALSKNITLLATLFHWDSPQSLQDEYGGWQNDQMITDIVAYAETCFQLFGDRIKYWITLNEPLTFVNLGYGNGVHAPGLSVANPYEIVHRCIIAHARIYHCYHEKYAQEQQGKVSIALNSDFVQPVDSTNPEDRNAAERGLLWRMGIYADPLFFGDYPKELRDRCGERLPRFQEDIQDTLDFFSLNHYTTLEARSAYNQDYSFFSDPQVIETFPANSIPTTASWLYVYPYGIYGMMGWLQERYDLKGRNLDLVITESGVATPPHQIDDNLRVIYLDGYIRKALQAQADFGISLVIYCVWSLMDNFEWAASYSENYGLLSVNFETPERTRTPKTSAYWLREQTFF